MTRPIYTLIFTLLLPLVLLRLFIRSRKAPEYRKRWAERFGVFKAPKQKNGIWFHTVSVGEFLAAIPLIEQVMDQYPDRLITITTTTPTGSAQVQQRFADQLAAGQIFHVYLPYDIPFMLNAFLKRVRPKLLVILETELWPNLIDCTARSGCKVMVANARLSAKSANGYGKFEKLVKPMLARIDRLAVQSPADAGRFTQLGMSKENLSVTGSIKFDVQLNAEWFDEAARFQSLWGHDRKVWIMASTHKGEDEIAIETHKAVLASHPDALLILVPRHPERFQSVANMAINHELVLGRRSDESSLSKDTQVVLVDSMGELMGFLAASQICCMGGTFVENGGHNPLEPAALGLPVIMGPSQFNFAQICDLLTQAGGLKTVSGEKDLTEQILIWLSHESQRIQTGEQAKSVVEANRGARQKVYELINEQL